MNAISDSNPPWGASYRLIAAEKWKAKSAAMGRDATEALVEYACPRPGMNVLDLASGTGEPAITLASRVAPTGQVTALDLSPELLEIAAERARQRDLTNFTTQQADAHHLPFADATFDLVTSRFGVMFFQDCLQALRETRRVLKPAARACFLAWGTFQQPYWSTMMGVVHERISGPLLAPGGPDPFRFAEPCSLSRTLRQAGFDKVEEETRTLPWTWPGTPQEVWELVQAISAPFLPMLQRVPAEKWDEINRAVYAAIEKYVVGNKIQFGATLVFASAVK